MELIRKITEILSRIGQRDKLTENFIFPYSSDPKIKREQIWNNLQKGLLFEDNQTFIPWQTPYNYVRKFEIKRHDSGDRTNWYLGKRKILDGYEGHFEVMKWCWYSWRKPIKEISENIGHDLEGMKNFRFLETHITNLLGEPIKKELEKFGSLDIGEVIWRNKNVTIRLIGIEIFNCRYQFKIGINEKE
ncbi:hypothetical protein HYN48_13515 [Flavobacterium magnum]|uniref:Uncharacterized protein n=1 Tax=Flavobacterium magnum TaxID=2162713 RepID=A0A2S0RIH2_9FLAO|nr:hypothetical protein [Flavobacterium magnum]AWA31018.1 hypothetical protein HYN48_13515 [Flavobacterium magnum]